MSVTTKKVLSAALLSLGMFVIAFGVIGTPHTFAVTYTPEQLGLNQIKGPGGQVAQGQDPRALASAIINWALGFLGILAVGLILLSGFEWMTANGDEKKTENARNRLIQAVVGLIIIFSAWGVAAWVVSTVAEKVGGVTQ